MLVFLFLTFATLTFTCDQHDHTDEIMWEPAEKNDLTDDIISDDSADDDLDDATFFYKFTGTETINGVDPEDRKFWMRLAMQTRKDVLGACPSDAFGAVLVNRSSNQLLCATTGLRSDFDRTDHAEMRIIRECSQLFETTLFPGAGGLVSTWQQLSLYTTGESCAMCMGACVNIGLGENIYATSINYLLSVNTTQIDLKAKKVEKKAIAGGKTQTDVISFRGDILNFYNELFSWQNQPLAACPPGCIRQSGKCVPNPPVTLDILQ